MILHPHPHPLRDTVVTYDRPCALSIQIRHDTQTGEHWLLLLMQFRAQYFVLQQAQITEEQAEFSKKLDNAVAQLLKDWVTTPIEVAMTKWVTP